MTGAPIPPPTPRSRRVPILLAVVAVAVVALVVLASLPPPNPGPKATALGTAFSPANVPNSSPQDVAEFFRLARQIGSHVTLIVEWAAMPALADLETVARLSRENGLAFHLHLSPIALYGGRQEPAIPPSVNGTSFNDTAVRDAFVAQALALAAVGPDVLGLGTEVNLLAQNATEFPAYVSLVRAAHDAVKAQRPAQDLTVSFQWDVLLTQAQFDVLPLFDGSVDVWSFTTYPGFFGDPASIPANYYTSVRDLLPTERIGFSEVGWPSVAPSSEAVQAAYYARLPALFGGMGAEFVTLALLHDVDLFTGELEALNSVGVRHVDGRPKAAWDVVANLAPIR